MGRVYESVSGGVRQFIEKQSMFFVATAPLASDGHVNLSPKGLDTFRIIDDHTVAYLDLTGSGAETIAHINENGRITIMFCAFSGPPRIVRVYGTGRVIRSGDEFAQMAESFEEFTATRSFVVVDVDRVSDSCGYGVPLMELVEDRSRLIEWAADKTGDDLTAYWAEKNHVSIDGLPAVQ
ncbi:MAG: pyridoxamine 5'-phosphate oxidase family protein [Acidimicrobiia bacterium]|nr:pyridoxamine 5'-phosphate oxidase family protein [Acidimicrobiia bacterium]